MGECKWRSEDFPAAELEKLLGRASLVSARPDARYYAFSKTGFTDACRAYAKGRDEVRLVSFSEMADDVAGA